MTEHAGKGRSDAWKAVFTAGCSLPGKQSFVLLSRFLLLSSRTHGKSDDPRPENAFPPGIPVLMPGEVITEDTIRLISRGDIHLLMGGGRSYNGLIPVLP